MVAARIERAASLDELEAASDSIAGLLAALDGSGVKIRAVAEMVTELNRRTFARLFEFLAPPELRDNGCLLIMGSEGRGEQLARTDQDNALILRDGAAIDPAVVEGFGARFAAAMVALGYPPCPGKMMVSEPLWRQDEAGFRDAVAGWIDRPEGLSFVHLAALMDAECVAGDPALLAGLKRFLFARVADTAGFLSRFALAVTQFETPIGFFHQILLGAGGRALDVKKGGIFPVVHGARALALERHIEATNTFDRIKAIAETGFFDVRFAADLAEAFDCLLGLRLHARLARGSKPDGDLLRAADLTRLQRDALRDSLLIVKQFKELVAHHFRLGAF
jgi:CBS domain-containing protein